MIDDPAKQILSIILGRVDEELFFRTRDVVNNKMTVTKDEFLMLRATMLLEEFQKSNLRIIPNYDYVVEVNGEIVEPVSMVGDIKTMRCIITI